MIIIVVYRLMSVASAGDSTSINMYSRVICKLVINDILMSFFTS